MSRLQATLRSRCAPMGRRRQFTPTLDGLEGRQLLSSLYLRGSYSGSAVEWQTPPTGATVNLGTVADVTWLAPADNVGDTLIATVNWGDGTPTETYNAGTFRYPSGMNGVVVPQHTFQQVGSLRAQITVTDQHGGICTWSDPFTVADSGYTIDQEELTPVGVASNVVGAKAPFFDTIVKPGDPTGTASIQILSCAYTARDHNGNITGAFTTLPANGVVVDANGYHVTHTPTVYATTSGTNSCYVQDVYWSETPGTYTVKADITWSDSRGLHRANPVVSTETITRPTTVMTPTMNNQDGAIMVMQNGTSYTLTTVGPNLANNAMDLQVSIDASQHGVTDGTYGVVQTMVRNLFRWAPPSLKVRTYSTGGDATNSLLDPTPTWETADGNFTPYYGTPALDQFGIPVVDQSLANTIVTPSVTTWNVGTIGEISDSPSASLDTSFGYTAMSDSAVYTDTVMFTPAGGIPVPIASMQWGYRASLAFDANGTPVVLWPSEPDVVTAPAATNTYPTWVGIASNYRYKTPVPWTTPPTVS